MEIPIYQVDAFASGLFKGNPAAVCLLTEWLPDSILLNIAAENNLAETAFCIKMGDRYNLRWFTPELEIDLCGHATLATSHILMNELNEGGDQLVFETKSGELTVKADGNKYTLDFPSRMPEKAEVHPVVLRSLGVAPLEHLKSRDYVYVYESEKLVRQINPDQNLLASLNDSFSGIIITAPGEKVDFVSRFFTPGASVFEDPVTGSAHCSLIPYWSEKLNKKHMKARQLSTRGGEIDCVNNGDRVLISGSAITYLKGRITI